MEAADFNWRQRAMAGKWSSDQSVTNQRPTSEQSVTNQRLNFIDKNDWIRLITMSFTEQNDQTVQISMSFTEQNAWILLISTSFTKPNAWILLIIKSHFTKHDAWILLISVSFTKHNAWILLNSMTLNSSITMGSSSQPDAADWHWPTLDRTVADIGCPAVANAHRKRVVAGWSHPWCEGGCGVETCAGWGSEVVPCCGGTATRLPAPAAGPTVPPGCSLANRRGN